MAWSVTWCCLSGGLFSITWCTVSCVACSVSHGVLSVSVTLCALCHMVYYQSLGVAPQVACSLPLGVLSVSVMWHDVVYCPSSGLHLMCCSLCHVVFCWSVSHGMLSMLSVTWCALHHIVSGCQCHVARSIMSVTGCTVCQCHMACSPSCGILSVSVTWHDLRHVCHMVCCLSASHGMFCIAWCTVWHVV